MRLSPLLYLAANDHAFKLYAEEDPMYDIIALEDEAQAVSDLHNGYLCTVE